MIQKKRSTPLHVYQLCTSRGRDRLHWCVQSPAGSARSEMCPWKFNTVFLKISRFFCPGCLRNCFPPQLSPITQTDQCWSSWPAAEDFRMTEIKIVPVRAIHCWSFCLELMSLSLTGHGFVLCKRRGIPAKWLAIVSWYHGEISMHCWLFVPQWNHIHWVFDVPWLFRKWQEVYDHFLDASWRLY